MPGKIVKHGDGLALVLDQAMIDELALKENTIVDAYSDGEVLVIRPIRHARRKRVDNVHDEISARYGDVFRRLVE